MMYAGSKNKLVHTVQLSKVSERLLTKTPIYNKTLVLTEISGHRFKKKSLNHTLLFIYFFFSQVFEIRNTEDLTEEWLREKLRLFG